MPDVLVIAGPAGVGKSSVAFELSLQLQRQEIAHALIDTDGLDRVFPVPPDLPRVTERNLAAVWGTYLERGIHRLILVGVLLDQPQELEWISRAVPDARLTLVRLTASTETIIERVRYREVGSGGDAQIGRTNRQIATSAQQRTDAYVIPADGPVTATASSILNVWAAGP